MSQRITFKIALIAVRLVSRPMSEALGDMCTPIHTVAARSRLRSTDHGDLVVTRMRSTRLGCRSFCVCGPTIWNKLKQDLWSTDTREQFKRGLKRWLFECAYGTRRVWWTLTEGTLYRWTYLLTYWCNVTQSCRRQCLNYVCLAEVMLQL